MRVACLFSGGKDSVFALWWAMQQGFEPILVTVEPEEYSMMFHHPNIEWTKLQAEAAGVKQVFVKTNNKKELADLERELKKLKVDGIVTGAVESEYQKQRIDSIGNNIGIPTYSPLWHKSEELLDEMLRYFEIYITAVSAEGLGKEFLSQPFKKLVEAKIKNVHRFLEGGEGETFVCDTPFFKKRIVIKKWGIKWDGIRGIAEIVEATLSEKQ